jgi:hypothetical protein
MAEMGRELGGAISGLNTGAWDGQSRYRAEPMLDRVRPESRHVTEELNVLGRKLLHVADTFDAEDGTAAQNLAGIGWVEFEDSSYVVDLTGKHLNFLSRFADDDDLRKLDLDHAKSFIEIMASIGIVTQIKRGGAYGDQIFYGSRNLKDLAGVSSHLTHIKTAKIHKHMAKEAWSGGFSKGNFLLEGVSEAGENWEEFGGDTSKVATGIMVDTAFGVTCSAAGAWAGAGLGALAGSALGPAGAVIGGKVGSIVGAWAGGEFAEWAEDWKVGSNKQELDKVVVDTVDGALNNLVDGVTGLFD